MKMKIPAQYLAAAAEFQASKDARHYLVGVCLRQKSDHIEVCATNGHILLKIDHDSAEELTQREVIVRFTPDQLRELRKKGNRDKVVELHLGKLNPLDSNMMINGIVSPLEIVDGKFPDYDKIIPENPEHNGKTPAFNANYWQSFAKAAVFLTRDTVDPAVQVRYSDETSAARVEFPLSEVSAVGVIMPVRV